MNEIELKSRAQRVMDRANNLGFRKDGKLMVIDQAFELVAAGEGLRNQHILRVMAQKATAMDAAKSPVGNGVYSAGYKPGHHIAPLVLPRLPDDKFIEALLVAYGPDFSDSEISFAFEQWRLLMETAASRAGQEPITEESEAAAQHSWVNSVNRMMLTDEEEILHLEGFIRDSGLMGEFVKYIAKVEAEQSGAHAPGAPADTPTKTGASVNSCVTSESFEQLLQGLGFEVKLSEFHRPFWECANEGSDDFETEAEAWADAYRFALETAAESLGSSISALLAMPVAERVQAISRFNPVVVDERLGLLTKLGYTFKVQRGAVSWSAVDDVLAENSASTVNRAVAQAWDYAKSRTSVAADHFDALPFDAQRALLETAHDEGLVKAALDKRQRSQAQAAYEAFSFPSEVVEASGWETWSGSGVFTRSVFLATADGEDTRRVVFEVKITGATASAQITG